MTATSTTTPSEETGYKVHLDCFEGPLDLLLYLIKKEEVAIYDVSLEKIIQQYLSYLQQLEKLHVEIAGEFIVMAAHLLYIKSRTLLPKDLQAEEELEEEEDPGWELIRQLIEYKKFKEAATELMERDEEASLLFAHPGRTTQHLNKILTPQSTPQENNLLVKELSLLDLLNAFERALKRTQKETEVAEIYQEHYTVSDRILFLQQRLQTGGRLSFMELFTSSAPRTEKIVTFLALLELVRNRELVVTQEIACGAIWIDRVTSPISQ